MQWGQRGAHVCRCRCEASLAHVSAQPVCRPRVALRPPHFLLLSLPFSSPPAPSLPATPPSSLPRVPTALGGTLWAASPTSTPMSTRRGLLYVPFSFSFYVISMS